MLRVKPLKMKDEPGEHYAASAAAVLPDETKMARIFEHKCSKTLNETL